MISYVLALGSQASPVQLVIDHGITGAFQILIGEPTLEEVEAAYRRKRFLQAGLPPAVFASTLRLLQSGAEVLPHPTGAIPPVCRDPRDDSLIALALAGAATHLLTGDRDLLALDDGRFPFRVLDAATLAVEFEISRAG